jgi:phytoene synthase
VKALRRFWERTCRAAEGDTTDAADAEIWHALAGLFARHALPLNDFREMLNGQLSDLRKTRYDTFDELYEYCVRVASTVGTLCIELWGYDGRPETRQLAVWRGVAFQLTNIARDVREDALADRVYVPAELAGSPLTPADVLTGAGRARRAVRRLLERASDYYARSAPLDARVAPSAQRCLWTMTETYRALLCKIAANPSAVLLPGRVRLGSVEKLGIVLRSALR